jgi:hypothetical protein
MIDKGEIRKVIETIDVFKLLSIKGESERAEYGRISLIWGLFSFFIFLYFGLECSFLGENGWVFVIFAVAFFHTLPISTVVPSLLYWSTSSLIIYILLKVSSSLTLFYVVYILLLVVGFIFLYRLGTKRKTIKNPVPIKYSLSGQIGITWMLIFSSVSLVLNAMLVYFNKNLIAFDFNFLYFLIYGYILSIAIFISGLIVNFYFILGIVGMFLVPIVGPFSAKLGYILISLLALVYGLYGGYVYVKNRPGEEK